MGFAAALPHQLDPPARATDALDRERGRGRGRDPPARDRGGRNGERVAALAGMAFEQQSDRLAALGRELQPPGIWHRGALHLADHSAQAAMPYPLLHQREQFGIVIRLGIDDAVGREPRLVQARREQIAAPHHPQYRPPGTRGDSGHEQGRGGIIAKAGAGRSDLMEGIESQPSARQPRIDCAHAERQYRAAAQAIPLDRAQGFA